MQSKRSKQWKNEETDEYGRRVVPEALSASDGYQPTPHAAERRIIELREQKRALFELVDTHIAKVTTEQHPNFPTALQEFKNFFEGYTDYFFNEARQAALAGKTLPYPRILATALQNTRDVWGTLNLAINQRFNPIYAQKLVLADKFAQSLLEQSVKIINTQPIIYFDKLFHIVRYPYQAVPLLSVPFDRFEIDGRSAMAHELGHFVFWNNGEMAAYRERTKKLGECIAQIILDGDLPKIDFATPDEAEQIINLRFQKYHTWMGWLEETFADIYGTLMVGPTFAKNAQDILVREIVSTSRDLLKNDGEHPMPILRPLISLAVLKQIGATLPDTIAPTFHQLTQQLDERWRVFRQDSSQLDSTDHWQQHNHAYVRPVDFEVEIESLVAAILTAPLFILSNEKEVKVSLLEGTDHWGKRSQRQLPTALSEIQTLLDSIQNDLLSIHVVGGNSNNAMTFNYKIENPESSFSQLLQFMRTEATNGVKRSETEEWETLLNLKLALSHGHQDQNIPLTKMALHVHDEPIWHKH